jgi:hypothetical protein
LTKTLIAFSGGTDSTFLAWKRLTESKENITLFFLDARKAENGEKVSLNQTCELAAALRIVDWLSHNVRVVTFWHIDSPALNKGEWMSPTVMRVGGDLMSAGFDKFHTGRSIENTRAHWGQKTQAWYLDIFAKHATRGTISFPLLEQGLSRAHALAYMPQDLQALTMGCFDTKMVDGLPVRCGKCFKCMMEQEVRDMLAAGGTADEICDHQLQKRGAGKYAGQPTDPAYGLSGLPFGYKIPEE